MATSGWVTRNLLAAWLIFAGPAAAQDLAHPPGSPIAPICTISEVRADTCGVQENGALIKIIDGTNDADCWDSVTGGGGFIVWCEWSVSGAKWTQFVGGTAGGATVLDELGDVVISAPALIREYIRHNGSNFENSQLQLGDEPAGWLTEAELDSFVEWRDQISLGGVCSIDTWVRGDGQCAAVLALDGDASGVPEFFLEKDNTPVFDFFGVCMNMENASRTDPGTTTVCLNNQFNDGTTVNIINNGYCHTVGYMDADKNKQNVLDCVFDPSDCMDAAATCNDELQAFFDAIQLLVEADDDGFGPISHGVRIRFPRQYFNLDLKSDPVYIEQQGIHFDCTNHPYILMRSSDGTVKTFDSGTNGSFTVGSTTVDDPNADFCGVDTVCANRDDPVKAGHILWPDADTDKTYLVQRIVDNDTILINPAWEGSTGSEAYTVSVAGAFYFSGLADYASMSGRCQITCAAGSSNCPVYDSAGAPIGGSARTQPISVVVAGAFSQVIDGFHILSFHHKNDYGIVSVSDSTGGGEVFKTIGGTVQASGDPDIMKTMRTGGDANDPTDNGRGAAFAVLAGGTTVGRTVPARGDAGRCIFQGSGSIGTNIDVTCENVGQYLWAPLGAVDLEMWVNTSEQDLNCDGSPTCENDFAPFIDIGPMPSGVTPGSYMIDAANLTFISAERQFLKIEDPNSSLFLTARVKDNDGGDVLETAAGGIKLSGSLHSFEPTSGCTLDADFVKAGFTLCCDEVCTTYDENGVFDTSLKVNGQNVCQEDGTNCASAATTTTIENTLSAGEWIVPLTGGPDEIIFGSTFPRTVYEFGQAGDESAYIEEELHSGFRTADAMTITVNWSTSSTATTQAACWCITAADYAEGAASDPTGEETKCAEEAPTAVADQRRETIITLTATSYAGTNGLALKLLRDVDNGSAGCGGTALAADVRLHSVTLAYGVTL